MKGAAVKKLARAEERGVRHHLRAECLSLPLNNHTLCFFCNGNVLRLDSIIEEG